MALLPYHFNEEGTLVTSAGLNAFPLGPLDFSSSSFQSSSLQPDVSTNTLPTSSIFGDPILAPLTKSTGGPTKEDWGSHRALIKRLYLIENKPLAEVMRIMRNEHDFKAT